MSEQSLCDNRGPRIGEDGTRCRRPSGHVGDHATAPEDGFGNVRWSQWADPMTSVPPTQPPAAPETDASAFGDVEAEVARARAPRVSSCCYEVGTSRCRCVPMCHIPADRVAALLERVRVVESERDAAMAEERERIAQAIESQKPPPAMRCRDGLAIAAQIAREAR